MDCLPRNQIQIHKMSIDAFKTWILLFPLILSTKLFKKLSSKLSMKLSWNYPQICPWIVSEIVPEIVPEIVHKTFYELSSKLSQIYLHHGRHFKSRITLTGKTSGYIYASSVSANIRQNRAFIYIAASNSVLIQSVSLI